MHTFILAESQINDAMPKNLLHDEFRLDVLNRLSKLSEDDKALFGVMNANQMLCHVNDQIRIALGDIQCVKQGNILHRTLIKWLLFAGVPFPKGRTKTMPEVNQNIGGTSPINFKNDLQLLSANMDRFIELSKGQGFVEHPFFGEMNPNEWGKMVGIHLDHHLKQFGQ